MLQEQSFALLIQATPQLLESAWLTLQIALFAVLIGGFGGIGVGMTCCYKSAFKWKWACKTFVCVVRGTPLFVQLLIMYYALPELLGFSFSPFTAGVLTLGINSTAYISEIIRGGVDALPEGQWETSYVLGYTKRQTLQWIILPQVVRHTLPSLVNELTSLIKETSILMVIGVAELTKVSKDIVARELDPMTIYLAAAVLYLLMTSTITLLTNMIQKRVQS